MARAQEETDFFRISLEDLLRIPVSVASRTEEDLLHAPSTVTVFTREEIEMLGVRTVLELLDYVPGFTTTNDSRNAQNAPSIHVRGVNRGDFGTHVLLLIDGQRLNNPSEGGAGVLFRLLSAGDIDRVEVIRGPGSALYGGNAFLAVVDIRTRRGAQEVVAMVGPEGTVEARGAAAHTFGDTELSLYTMFREDVGQQYTLHWGEEVDDPRQNSEIHLAVRRGNAVLDLFQYAPKSRDGLVFYAPGQGDNEASALERGFRFRLDRGLAERGTLRLFLSHLHAEENVLSRFLPAGSDLGLGPIPYDLIGGPRSVTSQTELQAEWCVDLPRSNQLLVGAAIEQQGIPEYRVNANYIEALPDPNGYLGELRMQETEFSRAMDGQHRSIQALYAQDRFAVGETLLGFAGVRVDHYEFVGAAVNPRATIIWSVQKHLALKAQFGSAFRAPTISEQHLGSPITIPNPDLSPERVRTWEVGSSFEQGVLGLAANYFYTQFEDEIVEEIVTGSTITRTNGEDRSVDGFEFQAMLQRTPRFRLIGNLSIIDDGVADDSFERLGSMRLFWKMDEVDLTAAARYRGEQPSLPTQDAYWLFDAQLRWSVDARTRIFLRAENLLDITYSTFGAGFVANDYALQQRRRELLLGVQWTWEEP